MKLNPRAFQRPLLAVALTSLAFGGASFAAIVSLPASSGSTTTEMTLVDPAADEVTTTSEAPVAEPVAADADRAELAAARAEGAADRAEVSAVKAETVITSTTTTTAPTTTSTTGGGPALVGVTSTPEPPTTTTTTAPRPKTWVVVARIPVSAAMTSDAPVLVNVELQTGQLRVTGLPTTSLSSAYKSLAWFADDEASERMPTEACPPSVDNTGTIIETSRPTTPDCVWRGSWPSGSHTIAVGSYDSGSSGVYNPDTDTFDGYRPSGWVAPYGRDSLEIVIEEYR